MLAASSSGMLASRQPRAAAAPSIGPYAHRHAVQRRHGVRVSCRATPEQQHSAARRLYEQALADSLHDLSLDFDKTYLKCRCTTSVPVCMEDEEEPAAADLQDSSSDAAAEAQLTAAAASQAQHMDCLMAGFQAFLQYQTIVGISTTAESSRLMLPQQVESQQQEQVQQQQLYLQQDVLQQSGLAGTSASIDLDSSSSSGSSSDPASPIDLLHCAVLIARHAYPTADLDQIRAAVADLGARAAAAAATSSSSSGSRVRALAAAVSHVLYDEEGYQGSVDDYYSPDSQCINRLLETKQGSPALLALLHKLVAAAAGLHLTAVTLPGHTFLQPLSPARSSSSGVAGWSASPYLIDPFNAGQVCSSSVVEARLSACWGYPGQALRLSIQHATLTQLPGSSSSSGGDVSWRGDRALLVRLLKNLRESYYGPLPLSGRIRWAMHLRHTGSSSSAAAASEAAAVLDKLIAAAAAAASVTSSLGSSSSSSDVDGEAVAATPGGRELLTGALAVVRYHRATAPHEVRLMRDEGYILHLLGRSAEGSALLQQYLAAAPAAADMHRVQEFVVADRFAPPPEA